MKNDRDIPVLICVFAALLGWAMWESLPTATNVRATPRNESIASNARPRETALGADTTPFVKGSLGLNFVEFVQPPVVFTRKAGFLMGSQAFTTAGAITFTPAAGVTSVDIVMIGGGGGGEAAGGGGGGGGGEARVITGHGCTPGVNIYGTVGAGGGGSTNGSATSLALYSASGGLRGGGVSTGTGGLGGTGGAGGTGYNGGNGGTWATGVGGGGGGAGGATGAGGNGGPTTGGTGNSPGGNGGAAGDPPINGAAYGGGGGGSQGMTDGGTGNAGYILITWTDPVTFLPCGTTTNQPFGNDGDLIKMLKNTAGQKIGCEMVTTAGAAFTGSVTVYVTGDAGTQAAGSVGSGACTHKGNGYHTYAPAQAETNFDLIGFTFVGSGAVPATIQAATVSAAPLDAAGVRSAVGLTSANLDTQLAGIDDAIDTEVAAIKAKTDLIPAAPAAVGDCITETGVRTAVGLATANLDTQLTPLGTGFSRAVKAITLGTVDTGATTTIIPTSSLSPAAVDANQFRGQVVCFANDTTTTALRGQKTDITGSSSGGILTVNELTSTPVSGDTFTIQ